MENSREYAISSVKPKTTIEERLRRIEAKLDQLLDQGRPSVQAAGRHYSAAGGARTEAA